MLRYKLAELCAFKYWNAYKDTTINIVIENLPRLMYGQQKARELPYRSCCISGGNLYCANVKSETISIQRMKCSRDTLIRAGIIHIKDPAFKHFTELCDVYDDRYILVRALYDLILYDAVGNEMIMYRKDILGDHIITPDLLIWPRKKNSYINQIEVRTASIRILPHPPKYILGNSLAYIEDGRICIYIDLSL